MANFQDMNQGKIIEYIDQGKLISGLCLQDKGNKLHLLTIFNREVNLSAKRALLISNSSLDTLNPREELLQHLRQAETLRNTLKDQVHVKDLWELIMGEDESFDYTYLAQLSFGEEVTDDHISALVRALFEENQGWPFPPKLRREGGTDCKREGGASTKGGRLKRGQCLA
jgi:exoribonuclease-2